MKKTVDLKPKKPILAYMGMDKKTLTEPIPSQVVEVVYPQKAFTLAKDDIRGKLFEEGQINTGKNVKATELPKNRLIWTNDNLVALKTLLDEKDPVSGEYRYRNKISLIYLDPPFMVQDDFVTQNSIDIEVDEEEGVVSIKEPTIIETIAYKDTWKNGLDSFLQMMRERLVLMKELLAPTGLIYVHLDWHATHYVKVLMDEIFDYGLFFSEVIWSNESTSGFKGQADKWIRGHDTLLCFSKTSKPYFKKLFLEKVESTKKRYDKYDEEKKDWYKEYTNDDGTNRRVYLSQTIGSPIADVWTDIPSFQTDNASRTYTGYPTQKPIRLLKRIIEAGCPHNGTVLDAFVGSGTTCEAAEQLSNKLDCSWIGIDNSKFAIHTARKRLIELNGKPKGKKNEGVFKVRPFTVENMGYYQRGVKWDPIQVSNQADSYRKAIIELFGGEYSPYSKLLHGKKRGAWIHVGPLSAPIVAEQIRTIAEEVKDTEFKKLYILSADFNAHHQTDIENIKKDLGVQVMVRLIPASAIEEVKKRLDLMKQGAKDAEQINEMPNIAFFAPLTVKINTVADGKEAMIELAGLEVDAESFLDSQKTERRDELQKWLDKKTSWQSFVDFWAIDWNYDDLKIAGEPVFENEWQSFRKRKGKKTVEDLVVKAFHTYDKPGVYTLAVKVTDVFGNDGIVTAKVVIK